MFSPELSQHWMSDQPVGAEAASVNARDEEGLSEAQQQALEALVDRVNAARSII